MGAILSCRRISKALNKSETKIISTAAELVKFYPGDFMGRYWSVWKGPIDDNGFYGYEDKDVREDHLKEVNWNNVSYETTLRRTEFQIKGEEKLLRLKKMDCIRLGGRTFFSLWQDYKKNRGNSILELLRKNWNIRYFDFFGLVLRSPCGSRYVLSLYWNSSKWYRGWHYGWLSLGRLVCGPAAVLANS